MTKKSKPKYTSNPVKTMKPEKSGIYTQSLVKAKEKLAYNKGKLDERKRIRDILLEYRDKGFELQTAIESAFNEPLGEIISKSNVKQHIKDKDLLKIDEEMMKEFDYERLFKNIKGEWDGDTLNITSKKSLWSRIKNLCQQLLP